METSDHVSRDLSRKLIPQHEGGCISRDLFIRLQSQYMAPEKSPGQGSLVVAGLIVLGILFAGHWIISYVKTTNPWAIIPWYGIAAVLIIVFGVIFANRPKP